MTDMGALDQLEPIETASPDELGASQLDRLQQTVRLAHDRVPHYKKKFEAARRASGRSEGVARLREIPVHHQERSPVGITRSA